MCFYFPSTEMDFIFNLQKQGKQTYHYLNFLFLEMRREFFPSPNLLIWLCLDLCPVYKGREDLLVILYHGTIIQRSHMNSFYTPL